VTSTNTASIGTGDTISAEGLDISATNPNEDAISATATSGAGAKNVGLAGSVAINVVTDTTAATIATGANVTANDEAVTLKAENTTTETAEAKPGGSGATTEGVLGIGASVAVNVVTARTSAAIQDGAVLEGASDLTLTATGSHTVTTTADNGAEATGESGLGAGISAAIAVVNNSTTANLGTALSELDLSGDLEATAEHTDVIDTTADGKA